MVPTERLNFCSQKFITKIITFATVAIAFLANVLFPSCSQKNNILRLFFCSSPLEVQGLVDTIKKTAIKAGFLMVPTERLELPTH